MSSPRRSERAQAEPAAARPAARRRRDAWVLALIVLGGTAALEAWRSHLSRQWAQPLAQRARPGDIQLISSIVCRYCTEARQWLTAAGVPFDECFIERDAACAARFQALQGTGTPLVLVRGQAQLGFSPEQVARRLGAPGA